MTRLWTRRQALALAGGVTAHRAFAQNSPLPLRTPGLEHIGMTVPDQEGTAKFYGRIFDPQLFQERDPPPRFYCKIGISYIAFGGGMPARIDHFCALVRDYNAAETRKAIDAAGIPMTGNGPVGMAKDPDDLRLQLLGVPGGLARTIIPSSRISQDQPAIQAVGFEHIMLLVTDLEKSAAHYRKFFGMESSRSKKPERIWFTIAKTRLGLEAAAGRRPAVDHIAIRVAGFDKKAVTEKLKKLSVEIAAANDEDLLRFKDPNGLIMELRPA